MVKIVCNDDLEFLKRLVIFEDKSIVISSYKVKDETVCGIYPITKIKHSNIINELIDETIDIIGLYKMNLFDKDILSVIYELLKKNKKVIILL